MEQEETGGSKVVVVVGREMTRKHGGEKIEFGGQ